MKQLALSINGTFISPPPGIPSGGFGDKGIIVIQVALTLLFVFAVILALIFVIYSGIQWTMSGGDKQKIQQARLRITFAIVGLIIAFLAFFIVRVVIGLILGGGSPGRIGGP